MEKTWRARWHCSCRRSSLRAATRSAFIRRERVLDARVGNWVGSDLWARLRAWTAWMASMLRTRPLTKGPRLSRGPHRTETWVTVRLVVSVRGLSLRKWVGFGCREEAMDELRSESQELPSEGGGSKIALDDVL